MSRKQEEEKEESEAKIKHNKNALDTILFSGSGSQHKKLQLPKVKIHKNTRESRGCGEEMESGGRGTRIT